MQELQLLGEKLAMLLKKHASLRVENKRLKKMVATHLQKIETLNQKLALMEQDTTMIQVGKAVHEGNAKNDVRKQLDTVIGEIDKILNTLND